MLKLEPRNVTKKKKKKKKSHIPFRLNLIFSIVFFSFIAVLLRLVYVQLVMGDDFETIVKRTSTVTTTTSVPRGSIYDSNGKLIVGNEAKLAIVYTRGDSQTAQEMVQMAQQLSKLIQVDTSKLKTRDLQDYWAATKTAEELSNLLTAEEKEAATKMTSGQIYELQLSHIQESDIAYSEAEKQAVAIYTAMNSVSAMGTATIKNTDVTDQEVALVNERLGELPGVNVTMDWERTYPMGELLSSILGKVSNSLPAERANTLLAQGYSLSDRVGTSYLEQQYESVLKGTKAVYETSVDNTGVKSTRETYAGESGSNLVLTIDTDFQKKVESIALNFLQNQKNELQDRLYIAVLNPKTGDVLALTGKKWEYENGEKKEIVDDALGVVNSSFAMGSTVKIATVLAGYMSGIISLDNNVILDEPLTFQGSQTKSSVFNRNGKMEMDDIQALAMSSNVYMMKIAMAMGGQTEYKENGYLTMDTSVFDKLRYYFTQFGLGTRTGIDLPSESIGFNGGSSEAYYALDLSFGQFDMYTTMQMAQYIATIANGGSRIAPKLVREIHSTGINGGIGALDTTMQPTVLNTIGVSPEILEHVKKGLYETTHSPAGTGYNVFASYPIEVSAKTGTAEAFYGGERAGYANATVDNSTFVSYAPSENPEIAVAVVVPFFYEEYSNNAAARVGKLVYDAYFNK